MKILFIKWTQYYYLAWYISNASLKFMIYKSFLDFSKMGFSNLINLKSSTFQKQMDVKIFFIFIFISLFSISFLFLIRRSTKKKTTVMGKQWKIYFHFAFRQNITKRRIYFTVLLKENTPFDVHDVLKFVLNDIKTVSHDQL